MEQSGAVGGLLKMCVKHCSVNCQTDGFILEEKSDDVKCCCDLSASFSRCTGNVRPAQGFINMPGVCLSWL